MKKMILLALLAVIMAGCVQYENPSKDYSPMFKTVYIDSCEWLMSKYTYEITHKGNCRFCKERDSIKWEKHKAEIVELLKRESID